MLECENDNDNDDDNIIREDNKDENVYPMKIYMDYQGLENQIQPHNLTQEQRELIQHNANYLSKHVWYWNEKDQTYQFNLPKTIFSQKSTITIGENYSNNKDIKYLNPQDENGGSLRKEHLEQIWQRGEFCVESTEPNFPYKWKLSKLTVGGVQNNIDLLKRCFSCSFNLLYLLRYRFIGNGEYKNKGVFFSSIFYALFNFMSFIFEMFIGVSSYYKNRHLIENKIQHDDLIQFITNNPNVKLQLFCHYNYSHLSRKTNLFQSKVWPKIKSKNEKQFYKEGLTTNDIEQRLYVLQKEEYLKYLYTQEEFVNLDNEFKCLDFLNAQQIIMNIEHESTIEKERLLKEFDLQLQKKSIRYEVYSWKDDQLKKFDKELTQRLTTQKNERIVKELAEYNEANLIFNKNASFNNNYDRLYKQAEAIAEKEPDYSVYIRRKCIRPYKIMQSNTNASKSVPLINVDPTNNNHNNDDKTIYKLQKYTELNVKSIFYGWRIYLYFSRFLIYTWNIAVVSLKMAFYSCISIQALFRFTLYTDDDVDIYTGKVYQAGQTYTLPRTLYNLKQWISTSRTNFEEQPDRGIFGKSFTRIFNIISNYIIKLIIFGVVILALYPIVVIVSTVFFLLCFFLSPALSLVFVVLELLWYLVIYDGISRKFFPLIRKVVQLFLIRFLLYLIVNVSLMVLQPVFAVVFVIVGIIMFILRYIYDFSIYYLVKCIAKIPVVDTCFAWKIEGPGLFRDRYFNIPDEDILLLLRGQLESDQLNYYNMNTIKQLEQPEQNLKTSVEAVYNYFNLNIKPNPIITNSIRAYKTKLSALITKRREQLPKFEKRSLVKFTKSRLSHVTELVKKYIIEFEKDNGLEGSIVMRNIKEHEDKYERLVELYLKQIFGDYIMETLEENDEIVYLESKSSTITDVVDVISRKLLEDPDYRTDKVTEKNKKQNENDVISRPKIATFNDVFSNQNDLYLDLKLLTSEEKKQYLGIEKETPDYRV